MAGAAWMGMCLFIYAFVGHYQLDQVNPQSTPQAGNIMIVFTCLFIAAFATTWGPLVWAIVVSNHSVTVYMPPIDHFRRVSSTPPVIVPLAWLSQQLPIGCSTF